MREFEDTAQADDPMLDHGKTQNGGAKIRGLGKVSPCCGKCLHWTKENLLLVLTVIAVILGFILGFSIRLANPSDTAKLLIHFPGQLLLRMLKMLIIPLIVSSLISGLAQLDPRACGKMGTRTMIYFMTTTVIAVILGIILVVAIHPGNPETKEKAEIQVQNVEDARITTLDAFLDLVRNMFPENLIEACFAQVKTKVMEERIPIDQHPILNGTNFTAVFTNVPALNGTNISLVVPNYTIKRTRKLQTVNGINVLGIICFCIGFGVVLSQLNRKAPLLIQFFTELNVIVMKMVQIIMWYSPVGIFFLVIGNILNIPNLATVAITLGMYMLTVCTGLLIHGAIILPLMYFVITRKNPFLFFRGMLQAWLTALGTASSSATLPITFRCLEENNHLDKRVTRLVLPIGATINMDGTALYEAVAAIFIAQLNNRIMTFGEICTISITATLASIGAASIPSAGLVTMVMVLITVDLPPEDIGIIVTVDWLLDRLRTSVNVLGDAFGSGIVQHLSRFDLAKQDEEHRNNQIEAGLANNDITPNHDGIQEDFGENRKRHKQGANDTHV